MEWHESQAIVVDDDDDDDDEHCNDEGRSADAEAAADVPSSVEVRWWYGGVGVIREARSSCVKFVLRLCVRTREKMAVTLTVWETSDNDAVFAQRCGVRGVIRRGGEVGGGVDGIWNSAASG